MNGEKELSAVELKVKELLESLDSYNESVGFNVNFDLTGAKYMSLSAEEIRSLSTEELGIASIKLEQYAIYIQKKLNREIVVSNWCETNIKRTVAKVSGEYNNVGYYNEKVQRVICDNIYARALSDIKRDCDVKIDGLQYIASSIKSYAQTFLELQKTKRGKYER